MIAHSRAMIRPFILATRLQHARLDTKNLGNATIDHSHNAGDHIHNMGESRVSKVPGGRGRPSVRKAREAAIDKEFNTNSAGIQSTRSIINERETIPATISEEQQGSISTNIKLPSNSPQHPDSSGAGLAVVACKRDRKVEASKYGGEALPEQDQARGSLQSRIRFWHTMV
jgi:hypothetical protein